MADAIKIQFVIAVNNQAGCYGTGKDRREATNNCNRQTGRNKTKPTTFYYFSCKSSEVTIHPGVDLYLHWPVDATVMIEKESE